METNKQSSAVLSSMDIAQVLPPGEFSLFLGPAEHLNDGFVLLRSLQLLLRHDRERERERESEEM